MSGGFIVTAQSSFLQLNSIFISILIEAIPFILIGVILSGIIQMFVSEEMIARIMPKNRFLAVLFGALAGVLSPASTAPEEKNNGCPGKASLWNTRCPPVQLLEHCQLHSRPLPSHCLCQYQKRDSLFVFSFC